MISHAFVSSVSRNGCPVSGLNYISFLLFQVFEGNKDSNSVFTNRLSQPIRARFIRFIPMEWHNHISMRVEIYGCPGVRHLQIILLELYMVWAWIEMLIRLRKKKIRPERWIVIMNCTVLTMEHVPIQAAWHRLAWKITKYQTPRSVHLQCLTTEALQDRPGCTYREGVGGVPLKTIPTSGYRWTLEVTPQ